MQSIQPWLQDYAIGLAEERGVQYFDAPLYDKWKTVQLLEFLYIPPQEQEANVWARISDSAWFMTVKFTKEAVADFMVLSNGIRLTQYKSAIIRIKKFKLILAAVPTEWKKMTKERTLVLECNSARFHVDFSGRVGTPKDITRQADIKLWIENLRKDGGAGNILKDRRQERERKQQEDNEVNSRTAARHEEARDSGLKLKQASKLTFELKEKRPLHEDDQRWRRVMKDPSAYEPPDRLIVLFDTLPFEGDERDLTPDQRAVPDVPQDEEHGLENGGLDIIRSEGDSNQSRTSSPSLSDKHHRSSQPLSDWPPSDNDEGLNQGPQYIAADLGSSSKAPGEQEIMPESSQHSVDSPRKVARSSSLPTASYPHEPSAVSKPLLDVELSPDHHPRSRVARKVPPPKQPSEYMQLSGPERVLVPNSDTSMSQSQTQSQLQQRYVEGHIEDDKQMDQEYHPADSHNQPTKTVQADDIRVLSPLISHKRRSDQTTARPAKQPKVDKPSEGAQQIQSDDQQKKTHSVELGRRGRKRAKALELSSSDEDENGKALSADDKETHQEFIEKRALVVESSNKMNKDGDEALNGANAVATLHTAVARTQTPGQHEPEAWRQPSFMEKGKRKVETTTAARKRLLLKGFTANIVDIKADGLPWLSWKDLYQMLLRAENEIDGRSGLGE